MTPLAQQEHDAAEAKRQAWDVFVASLRDYGHEGGWDWIMRRLSYAFNGDYTSLTGPCGTAERDIRQFAEGYGWPDTLRALAQAMQADEQMKREAMDRR